MTRPIALGLILATLLPTAALARGDLQQAVAADYEQHLADLFVYFHEHPELSYRESKTAARIAAELRALDIEVTEGVGGTGVVGMIRNSQGPLVLVRADMDALPLREQSGLEYASSVTQVDITGQEVPVMHACGHDVHITSLVGTARRLQALRDQWSGTVMLIAQPAEERIGGARAMLDDGLYQRFGVPDYALAFHVAAGWPAGKVVVGSGLHSSSSDSVDITVHGIGAHGAYPHKGKDPIYIASEIVVALQGLVSREISPLEPAVVTVGSFHGGFKHNIIPSEVKLQLTVRADTEATRDQLLAGIKRIARGVALTAGLPEDLLPQVDVSTESTPTLYNDPALTERLRQAFIDHFGADTVLEYNRQGMGAEDFAYFVQTPDHVPGTYFNIGGTSQADLDAAAAGGPPIPSHHSPFFHIEPRPSVTMGTSAMTVAVMDLLKK